MYIYIYIINHNIYSYIACLFIVFKNNGDGFLSIQISLGYNTYF